MKLLIAVFLLFFIIECKIMEDISPVTTTTIAEPKQKDLSWKHPDWKLDDLMLGYQESLSSAKDIERICPKFKTLGSIEQRLVLDEFIVAISFYESSWNPKNAGVDVGTANNRDTWSIGLMQVSVADFQNIFGYTYEQLLTPEPNLHLALEILSRQVKKTGLLILPNSNPQRYFAVILDGNVYQSIDKIIGKTRAAVPACL